MCQSLTIKLFLIGRNLSPSIVNNIFKQKDNSRYNFRQISKFSRPLVKSGYHESESVSFLGPKMWDMLLDDCKDTDKLNTFKNKT